MSYIDLSTGFSQFDRDNLYRWETTGYLNNSNELLARILAHPDSERVASRLKSADNYAHRAVKAFDDWDYLSAARNAYNSYKKLLSAAHTLGIDPTPPSAQRQAVPNNAIPHQVDPVHPGRDK